MTVARADEGRFDRLGSPPPGHRTIAWAFGGIGLSLLLQIVTSIPLTIAFSAAGRSNDLQNAPGFIAASVILAGLCGLAAFAFASRRMRWSIPDCGIRRGIGFWKSIGLTVVILIVFGIVSRFWESLVHPPKDSHVVIKALEENPSFWIVAMFAIGAGVLAPIAEELLFRGLLFRTLTRLGKPLALTISGTVFGALHAGAVPGKLLPLLGFLGAMLAALYMVTGSIMAPMCLHAFINATSVGQTTGATDAQKAGWTYATLAVSWGLIGLLRYVYGRRGPQIGIGGSDAGPAIAVAGDATRPW